MKEVRDNESCWNSQNIYKLCLIAKSEMATADVLTNISISATIHETYDLSMFIHVSKTMKWFKVYETDIFSL